jgi:hypothetical protein
MLFDMEDVSQYPLKCVLSIKSGSKKFKEVRLLTKVELLKVELLRPEILRRYTQITQNDAG